MNKKIWISTLVIVVVIIIGIILITRNDESEQINENQKIIKIGVSIPLTGNASVYGDQVQKGVEIALQNINQDDSFEYDLEVVYEDNQFKPEQSLTAYNKLVNIDGLKYLLNFGGNICPVINPKAQQDKVVNFATGCNTLDFNDEDSYNFRFDVAESEASEALVKFMAEDKGIENLALIYIDNTWGAIVANTIKDSLDKYGINLVAEEKYSESSSDVRSQLAKIKSANSDAIFFLTLANYTPAFLRQLSELDINQPLYTNISVQAVDLTTLEGLADGVIYSAPKLEQMDNTRNLSFFNEFTDPNSRNFASWGFDSFYLLADALNKEGDDPNKVAEYLRTVEDYPGAFGKLSYDNHGELKLDYKIMKIEDGQFLPY
ncbi:MAG: ABC transporter substrate-binding protein [Patescibacteria group bacterium]